MLFLLPPQRSTFLFQWWKVVLSLCGIFILATAGCSSHPALVPLSATFQPFLYDDHEKELLIKALKHHMEYLESLPRGKMTLMDETRYTKEDFLVSLKSFTDIYSSTSHPLLLDALIRENFTIYQAGGRQKKPGEMLVTGYFEPILDGSLIKKPPFIYPLYAPPASLVIRKNPDTKKIEKGRFTDNNTFVPYYSREEIEKAQMAAGYELVYLADPFDAFILHIQGSGKIRLQDGSLRSIHYSTDNGHQYMSIGKLLVTEGKMSLSQVTLSSLRDYLKQYPEERERVFFHNKKYIFFNWEDPNGPYGSIGQPLTPGRSIAIDTSQLPVNTLAYLITRQPIINEQGEILGWKPLHRFVLPQDSGSAIKGPGRVDLFCGNSLQAEVQAGTMKESGKLYFLVKKKNIHP